MYVTNMYRKNFSRRLLVSVIFFLLVVIFPWEIHAAWEFITTWRTTAPNESITIPTHPDEIYDYSIDWWDGTLNTGQTWDATHSYASSGDHTIRITWIFPSIYMNANNDREKLRSVDQRWTGERKTMKNAFKWAKSMRILATDTPDLSEVTSMYGMFADASSFNEDIGDWNTENITDMGYMFAFASNFNQDISEWNTENVTTMYAMFNNATAFDQDIAIRNTENVTRTYAMFSYTPFNQDIGGWNVGNVTDMGYMFSNAKLFNQDIGNWNTESVTDMWGMFASAVVFDQDIGNWNTKNVTDMSNMFNNAKAFNQDIGDRDTQNVTAMWGIFVFASVFNQDISSWDFENVINMFGMRNLAGVSDENYDLFLQRLGNQNVKDNIHLWLVSAAYCSWWQARYDLVSTHNWKINDEWQSPDCNLRPTDILLPVSTIPEKTIHIGQLSITDNTVNEIHTYSLVSGIGSEDNGKFSLSTNGKLSFISAPVFSQPTDMGDIPWNNTYSIRVGTTDSSWNILEKTLVVSVTTPISWGGSASSVKIQFDVLKENDVNEDKTIMIYDRVVWPENIIPSDVLTKDVQKKVQTVALKIMKLIEVDKVLYTDVMNILDWHKIEFTKSNNKKKLAITLLLIEVLEWKVNNVD